MSTSSCFVEGAAAILPLMSEPGPQETVCLASIMVKVKGDFASPSELKLRNRIEKLLGEIGVGECVGSGSGMGMMDIELLVESQEAAEPAIRQAMAESLPEVEYTFDFMQAEGKREDYIEEKGGCGRAAAAGVLVLAGLAVGLWQLAHVLA